MNAIVGRKLLMAMAKMMMMMTMTFEDNHHNDVAGADE